MTRTGPAASLPPLPRLDALAGRPVAVTGAGGFIGRALVAALIAQGAAVTALVRSRAGAAEIQASGARVVVAPLVAGPDLAAALRGTEILFHFAYDMRASGAVNLAAAEALFAAARAAGVGRIVHASSVVVYDAWPQGGAQGEISEQSAMTGGGTAYRQAKIAMERRLLASGLTGAILQPTIVWGPGSALWTRAPMATLRAGGLRLPEPCGHCAALHVHDLVQATLRAGAGNLPGIGRYLITGPEAPGWDAFYQAYADHLGQGRLERVAATALLNRVGKPRPSTAPGPMDAAPSLPARISASLRARIGSQRFEALVAGLAGLRRAKGLADPGPGQLDLWLASPRITIAKAMAELGYDPQVTLARGMAALE